MSVKSVGPIVLHVVAGAVVFILLIRSPNCSEDECLRTLALVVSTVTWSAALALIVVLGRMGRPVLQALAWATAVLWVPIAWTSALALFVAVPSLGGA
jgi:hypothetical protein